MLIRTEQTPNPATRKFLPEQVVMESGTRDFADAESAEASPLAKALFERRAGQLIGEGERPEQQAGDQITTDVQVFQTLGSLDRPGYHRAHILQFGTQVQTRIHPGS